MPIACPACGRPNSERATQCTYCTKSLEGVAAGEPLPESSPLESATNRHLIILAPQSEGLDGRVEPFAEAVGMDPYDARLALQAERPRLLRKVESASDAKDLSARLASARIAHFTLAEADVTCIEVAPVRSMELMEEKMRLGLAEGRLQVTRYRDLALLVRGDIARERHRERGLGTIRGTNRPLTPGLRLHFYTRQAAAVYELDPEQFDWSVLRGERSASTPLNFRRLLDKIKERAPAVVIDRGFDWEPVVLSRTERGAEVSSALAGEESRQVAAVYDNESQFCFYSRWRYLIAGMETRSGTRGEPHVG